MGVLTRADPDAAVSIGNAVVQTESLRSYKQLCLCKIAHLPVDKFFHSVKGNPRREKSPSISENGDIQTVPRRAP